MEKLSAVTTGTFDGVHPGHREVVKHLREMAEQRGLQPVAVTFDRHPLQVIAPARAPKMICTADERDRMLRDLGVEVHRVTFDEDLRRLTARNWLERLRDTLGMRLLVTGYDHTFGSDGLGMSLADYRQLGAETGVEIEPAPLVKGFSSSAIRRALATGDMQETSRLLGRPFTLEGKVIEGNRLGRTIGYPTANLLTAPGLQLPQHGVYAAMATLGDGRRFPAVVNVGTRPTVTPDGSISIEAHLIGLHEEIYGKNLRIEFLARLRDERRFPSLDSLQLQIAADLKKAQNFFL